MVFCMALPRFASIRSKIHPNNYLRYTHEEGEFHGVLQFTGEELASPYSKFEIQKAAGNANGFVHIRCCYNNKYWVAEPSSDSSYVVVAASNEPNEDQSQLSCTLFEPVVVSISATNTNTVRFRHVQLRQYLSLTATSSSTREDSRPDRALFAQSSSSPNSDGLGVFSITDWDSILILPKNIMLRGNNGYLGAYAFGSDNYLQFSISTDHADPKVLNEVFANADGSVRIKNKSLGKFWRRTGTSNWGWILVDSDDTTNNNLDTLFSPAGRIDDHNNVIISLLSLGNNNFCKRFTLGQMISCLAAATTSLSDIETRLVVEEYVSSRRIYDVDFRLSDARIYDRQIISLATLSAANDTKVSQTVTASIGHRETISSAWNNSVSLKLGVTADLQSDIPKMVGESDIVFGDQFAGAYEWGETVSKETEAETKRTITVPPMTKITANLLGTQCSYDIPFTYTQRDTLMNGSQATYYNMDDGLFTGTNFVNYSFEIKQENL